jgi:CRP-like cAMP-binding protein
MQQKIGQLSQVRVFNKLPEVECAALLRLARPQQLAPGDFLCHQGDVWPHVVFLTTGELRWTLLSLSGREHVLYSVQPNHVFWAHSLFDDAPMPASLRASKAAEVYVWSRDVIQPVLLRHPQAMWEITRMHVEIMRRAREIIYGLAFQPVTARLASLLLESFDEQGDTSMERDLTLSDIAAMVASSPEVVCRILHRFQADGILEVTRAHITLHDQEALTRLIDAA